MTPVPQTHDYDVIIAGGGPVGLTLANLLGIYGVRTLVLEKDSELPDQPRAVSLDDESLRIWQQCGLIERIMPFVAEGDEGDVVFTYRSGSGRELFSMRQHGRPYGYARGNVFLYHRILGELLNGLSRFPHLDYRSGCEVTEFSQENDRVLVTSCKNDGTSRQESALYMVGCDGGRSWIRGALGIVLDGMAYDEAWLIVDTFSPELAAQPLTEGVEVWCDARLPTATIPLPGGYRRWEFLLRKKQFPNPEPCLDPKFIGSLISRRKPRSPSEPVRRLVHHYKACLARSYRQRRVFLAGDAVHLSPPFAGQGMATGLRDAANLGWKLAHVVSGRAAEGLLDSYEKERRPHQRDMLKLALRMGRMMMPRNRFHAGLVSLFFGLAGRFGPLRRMLEIRGQNVTPVYASEKSGRSSRTGHYLPQPHLADGRLFDDLLGPDFTLIRFSAHIPDILPVSERELWTQKGLHCIDIKPTGLTAQAYRIFDRWLDGCEDRYLIVRPDRFVCEDRRIEGQGDR